MTAPTAAERVDPDSLVGRTYTWHTGMTATVRGYAEDVSRSGDARERLVLILQTESSTGPGSLIVYPYRSFVAALCSWAELTITGSGHKAKIFGPRPDVTQQVAETAALTLDPGSAL